MMLLVMSIGYAYAQGKADIKFEQTTHNFGTFSENSPVVSYTFKFTNVGDAPLVIHQAVASCGCTVPVKQMAKDGCDLRDNGYPYPYVLMTKDGSALEDENKYTVVICGIPKVMKESGSLNLQDTGIVGLDAAKEYLTKVGELSSATLDDYLVQIVE